MNRTLSLRPFSVIKGDSERRRASIYAYKPLLDSHRLSEFLSEFSESIVIWMYRDYRAVAVSSENYFAPGIAIRDLTPVVANSMKNWRNKGVSDESRDFVSRFFSKKMKALDAGAIFWLIRNRLLTESGHFRDNRVFLCKYEDLVFRSDIVLRALYNRIHCAYPGKRVTKQINSYAINRGSEAALSAQVAEVCQDMLEKLDKAYSNQFSTNCLTCDSKSNALY